MNNDIESWATWARSQDWRVVDDASGYTHFFTPSGDHVGRYPATPSNPRRRMQELKVALIRNGLQIPPPSKKEQRTARREAKRKDRR